MRSPLFSKGSFCSFLAAGFLAGCGGGGGGGSTAGAPPTITPASSVTGDMLGLAPSRGWNYQVTNAGLSGTASLYSDPNPKAGLQTLVITIAAGLQPTVLTSASAAAAAVAGAAGFTAGTTNYTVAAESSIGSSGLVPGTPLLVPNSLTLNQTWAPAAGATATVTFIGTVPNASACPAPTAGASVRYKYPGYDDTISYVPGCGITDILNNSSGADFKLISVSTYASIGQLEIAKRVQSLTWLDTARSVLGLNRSHMPAASLFTALGF